MVSKYDEVMEILSQIRQREKSLAANQITQSERKVIMTRKAELKRRLDRFVEQWEFDQRELF